MNTLSRMLELFFNGYLHEIIAKKYKNVYCVFAGGDDLFLLGPWSEMPELAIEINTKFDEYTSIIHVLPCQQQSVLRVETVIFLL